MRGRNWLWLAFALVLEVVAGCTAGPNAMAGIPREAGHPAGFLLGLWHGIIAPIALIVSLFNPGVQMYEVHNNGAWYNLGFLLGVGGCFGGAARGSRRKSEK